MSGKLFTPDERAVCEKYADPNGELINKRAAVLLLLDDGKTQSQACEESGMSLGQLRYALTLFKKNGMSIFPQENNAVQKKEEREEVQKVKSGSKKKKTEKKNKPKKTSSKSKSEKSKKKMKKKMKKASQPKKKKKKKK